MSVKIYHNLDELPDGYQTLFEDAGSVSFFHSRPWYRALIDETSNSGDRLKLYGVEGKDNGAVPDSLFVARSREEGLGPIRQRVMEDFTNFYTMRGGPVLSTNLADVDCVINQFVAEICAERPRWDVVFVRHMEANSTVFQSLKVAFRRAGMIVKPYLQNEYWQEEIAARSFDEYLRDRGSRIRKKINRNDRLVSKSDRFVYDLITDERRLEEAISDYQKVYENSWKEPETYPDFIPHLIKECARIGNLRLGLMYYDGEPIATQLTFISGKTAFQYKMAYDQRVLDDSFVKNLSIGAVMLFRLLKHLIDVDKIEIYDAGTGEESFKLEWCTSRKEIWGLMACNTRTASGLINASRHVGGPIVSSLGRKILRK